MNLIDPSLRIRKGNVGRHVLELTQIFEWMGLIDEAKDVFDDEVDRAVRTYQQHNYDEEGNELVVDGIPGRKTLMSINTQEMDYFFDEPVPDSLLEIPKGGTVLGRKMLEIGLEEMKKGAREFHGNNRGEFVEKYFGKKGASGAWCAAFASWCAKRAAEELGVKLPFKTSFGAQQYLSNMRKEGFGYDIKDRIPQPGDIVVQWRGKTRSWKGHIGIVHSVNNGRIYVLEGNHGPFPAKVQVFSYELEDFPKLIGFATPGPVNE